MLKTSVSPIIYNNGDRVKTIKTDIKEVVFMQKDKTTKNEQLNKLILLDEDLVNNILVIFLNTGDNDNLRNYGNYEFTIDFIKSNHNGIRDKLLSLLDEIISNEIIEDVIQYYNNLVINEAKGVIYSLSRLLYYQDKHKTNYIGQEIDKTIKEWINLINKTNYSNLKKKLDSPKQMTKETVREYNAYQLNAMIPTLNYSIYNNKDLSFLELKESNKTTQEKKDLIKAFIEKTIHEAQKYNRYSDKIINNFIFNKENDLQLDLFQKLYNNEIVALKEKTDPKQAKQLNINDSIGILEAKDKGLYISDELKDYIENNDYINDLYKLYVKYQDTKEYKQLEQKPKDIDKWRIKANDFIEYLETLEQEPKLAELDLNFMLNNLAYSDYQKETYILNTRDEKDNKLLQATTKQLKAIDNARGGLVTFNESDTQSIIISINEQEQLYKHALEKDKPKIKKEIERLKKDLVKAEIKEKELKDEYHDKTNYLIEIYKSMEGVSKTTDYYKELKRTKKETEKRIKEIERIIDFKGLQLDYEGRGTYILDLNKRKHEQLKLSVENVYKQIATYTKEEQDMFDFIINKYLHNTHTNEVSFTLREYEKIKNRKRPTNNLIRDIQAIRLLFREAWSYYTNDDKSYTFYEKHLFENLTIKGQLVDDINNIDNANLDTIISLELTETLQTLLKDRDNYQYISAPLEYMQLNNDNEYLAKRLLKHLYRKARIEQTSIIKPSLDELIKELQYYGLKQFYELNKHKTYKTEIVDVMEKCLNILEGENHLNKKFIEVLDRQPFITYDTEYRGKSQETSINEWGKHKVKIKIYNLDNNKLIDMKQKREQKKKKATKK